MLLLSLFILGFSSLVTQTVMARELLVSFYGNEFFIGWILFGWLLWVGVGSKIIKFLRGPLRGLPLVLICHLLLVLLIPLTIVWIRLSKSFFVVAAGQIPDLMPALLVSFFAMAPLCLIFGIQFVAISEYGMERYPTQNAFNFLNRAYFYEALGFVLGGLAFSYWLVLLNEFETGAVLIYLNLFVVLTWLFVEKEIAGGLYFFTAAVLAAYFGLSCFLFSRQWNFETAALRFPNEQLIETKNTIYGNLAVTRSAHQLNFYESGLPVGTDRDESFNEFLVSLPMLSDDNPRMVLLIGSGFSGALKEILKYHPQQIFYAELDPSMIGLARSYIPEFSKNIKDTRVSLIKEDPRLSLKSLAKNFDVIIINLPNPSTALINRYFTDEFFKEVHAHLKPNGVMATHLKFAADSVSAPLANLGSCVYKTIKRNFSSVVLLPEDTLFILASQKSLPIDPRAIIGRLKSRGIHNYFVNAPAITYRYTTDRIPMTRKAFESTTTCVINTDLHPQGYLYNLIFWLSIFHQSSATMLASIMRTNYFIVLLGAVGLILFFPFIMQPSALNKYLLMAAMFVGGFSLMSAEVIVIYGFQVFFGNLYYKIAWIISAFMAAVAVGTFWGNKRTLASFIDLIKLHGGIGIYFVLWFYLMRLAQFSALWPWLWILLGAGIGVLIGLEFSCTNALFLAGQDEGKAHLGTMYAADLLGSSLGALGISVFMIPAYGVTKTLFLLVIINIMLAFVLFISRYRGSFPHPHISR